MVKQIIRTQKLRTPGPLHVSPTGRTIRIWGWRKPRACRECPCWDWPGVGALRRDYNGPPGRKGDADLFIVGEAPGTEELARGRQFIGPAGLLLASLIKTARLDSRNVAIQNAVRCAHGSRASAKPPRKAIRHCAPYLLDDISSANPRVVAALGEWAVRSLAFCFPEFLAHLKAGRKGAPQVSITKLDGIVFPVHHLRVARLEYVAVFFHPAYFLKPGRSRQLKFAYEKYEKLGRLAIQ